MQGKVIFVLGTLINNAFGKLLSIVLHPNSGEPMRNSLIVSFLSKAYERYFKGCVLRAACISEVCTFIAKNT